MMTAFAAGSVRLSAQESRDFHPLLFGIGGRILVKFGPRLRPGADRRGDAFAAVAAVSGHAVQQGVDAEPRLFGLTRLRRAKPGVPKHL